jgi:hypothetical protein
MASHLTADSAILQRLESVFSQMEHDMISIYEEDCRLARKRMSALTERLRFFSGLSGAASFLVE